MRSVDQRAESGLLGYGDLARDRFAWKDDIVEKKTDASRDDATAQRKQEN